FAALAVKENHPEAEVEILEKSQKLLAKVKVSGGGRCNVTNGCRSISQLVKAYPRGGKQLKKIFPQFHTAHAYEWFENRGVPLVIQEDGCVFPQSQDSQSIIDCFLHESRRLGVRIKTGVGVSTLHPEEGKLRIEFINNGHPPKVYDKVIVATGGSPKRQGLEWLEQLGHRIEDPVPSLFTFNMPNEPIRELMGIVVENAHTNIQGTKLKANGPLLITHWGMSGPAILVLSSFGARILADQNYRFRVQVNWVAEFNNDTVWQELQSIIAEHPKKAVSNYRPYHLPDRLWLFLLDKCDIPADKKWSELSAKNLNKLVSVLTNDVYSVSGKTTFKEEFVTCGGVSLLDVDIRTMQSQKIPNLYFAGEVLDIDAITGGYNFQAAWTTGFIAGKLEG
ncbi:MAG: NAD(P)/FAD-dependent oxidoreductase, partial [Flavobacteriales bacterium]|nr:NAD(P)/FAD-dependent oxidoreductase [Flavobacteriales bacterium]